VRIRGILLITLMALLLLVVPAQGAKLRSVSQTATAVGGTTAPAPVTTVVARCPKGTKALSGGYTTSMPHASSNLFLVSESLMTPNGAGWRVSGTEHFAAPAMDTVTAHVYCEKRSRALLLGSTIRTDSIPSLTGESTSNGAQCQEGTRAFSGGFSSHSSGAFFYSSSGSGPNWGASVSNIDGPSQGLYDVQAYCGRAKVTNTSATQTIGGPAGTAATTLARPCAKGSLPVGGGYQTSQPVGALDQGALVFDSHLAGKTWSISAVTLGAASQTVTAFGYCRPR
jgi:hypothetical protein